MNNSCSGLDEHGCKNSHLHYTLFSKMFISLHYIISHWWWSIEPSISSNISCPQIGTYKSSVTYRPSIPVSTCSTGQWTLSIGCENSNQSELIFSSSCRLETVPDVQVITSIKGMCLASWRTDHRFQRTVILYEQTRAFCLVNDHLLLLSLTNHLIYSDSTSSNNDSKLDLIWIELYKYWLLLHQCRK